VSALSYSPDGQSILAAAGSLEDVETDLNVCGRRCAVQIIDAQSLCIRKTIACSTAGFSSAAFSHDATLIAVCENLGELQLYTSDGTRVRDKFPGALSEVENFAVSSDGTLLAVTSRDRIAVYRTSDRTQVMVFDLHGERVHAIAFIPGSRRLAIGGRTLRVVLCDSSQKERASLIWDASLSVDDNGDPVGDILSAAVSVDGRLLAAATGGSVVTHDLVSSNTRTILAGACHIAGFFAVEIAPDGSFLLITGDDLESPPDAPRYAGDVPKNRRIPLENDKVRTYGVAVVWSIHENRAVARIAELGLFSAAAISPQSNAIAVAMRDGRICVIPFNLRDWPGRK
jgi:WD40 repeat protein